MGKKAIITGGSSGIGKGIVKELAQNGYDIVFSYNTHQEQAKNIAESMQEQYGVQCACIQANLSNKEEVYLFFEAATEILQGLTLLVNNAGYTVFENLLDMTEEVLDKLVHLDFMSYLMLMQQAAGYMVDHNVKGSIINITSSRSQRAYPGDGIYGAVKAGLNRAAESFALDVAPYGIRINNVAPGSIQVRHKEDLSEDRMFMLDVYKNLGKRIPLGRMGRPEDIAKAVRFLASEDASYITGITLRVDGGLILPGMPERPEITGHPWGFYQRESNDNKMSESK